MPVTDFKTDLLDYLDRNEVTRHIIHDHVEVSRVLGSISPTFYEQLLRVQRSRKRKKQLNLTFFLAILGSVLAKAARKTLVKLTPEMQSGAERSTRSWRGP